MPSNAYKRFNQSITDIDHLIGLYEAMETLYEDDKEGIPEGYEVLFRSAVVLMVSHWEAYIEDICGEALEHLVKHVSEASKLPKVIKKQTAIELKESKNEIKVWDIADKGWKNYIKERLPALKEARNRSFNTPKAHNTADFLKNALGITDIRTAWTFDRFNPEDVSKKLDVLIELRGQIAHRGRIKQNIDKQLVEDHVQFLRKVVSKTGGRINSHLKNITGKSLF